VNLEIVISIAERHAFGALELSDDVHLTPESAISEIIRQDVAQAFHFVVTEIGFRQQLRRAFGREVKTL
jgi:hypothetical protein